MQQRPPPMVWSPGFVAVGHVTKDLLPGGGSAVGGTVTYAALTAARLGIAAAIFTSAPPELDLSCLRGVELHVCFSPVATTFENLYSGQRRTQYVHSTARPLMAAQLPSAWRRSPLVLLGAVAGELGLDWLDAFPDSLVGVTAQGWMRQWDADGRVTFRPWSEAQAVLSRVDVLMLSEEDVAQDEATVRNLAAMARVTAVTRGRAGATVFSQGLSCDLPAFRAREVDPTGAGDVFAAAFLVRLRETGDPLAAAQFANCAASLSVERAGTTGIPSREQVEARLRCPEFYE